eukprot:PhF_6_TR33722/c1_g3_i6/m.49520
MTPQQPSRWLQKRSHFGQPDDHTDAEEVVKVTLPLCKDIYPEDLNGLNSAHAAQGSNKFKSWSRVYETTCNKCNSPRSECLCTKIKRIRFCKTCNVALKDCPCPKTRKAHLCKTCRVPRKECSCPKGKRGRKPKRSREEDA